MGRQSSVAVLIGSGPSLNGIDIAALRDFNTIAFNRSWVAWSEWGFDPTWYACLDAASLTLLEDELAAILPKRRVGRWFLNGRTRLRGAAVSPVAVDADLPTASLERICDLGNVGATALQLLAALGIRRVLMVGVDARYTTATARQDVNHFRPDYALRDLDAENSALLQRYVAGWPVAAAACRDWGMDVRNASPGTTLSEFPETTFTDGLTWISAC